MASPKGSKLKLKAKATPNKKPVSTKRGNDGGQASKASVKKSLGKGKPNISKIKF